MANKLVLDNCSIVIEPSFDSPSDLVYLTIEDRKVYLDDQLFSSDIEFNLPEDMYSNMTSKKKCRITIEEIENE